MKITVIGELCKDIFVYGDSKRLSPEAPVPVFLPKNTTENNGMAGNVVRNLHSMNNELKINFIHQSNQIKKIRYVDEKTNHMLLRVDENDTSESLVITENIMKEISDSDAVIISDYDKGFLNESDIDTIARFSKFSILDTKKRLVSSTIRNITFIKLNELEFKNNNQVIQQNYSKVLITKGINGTDYLGINYPSPQPLQTSDVSGAGDTFTAAFVLKYLTTKDIKKSILYANEMASIVVSKRGVATPN